MHYWARDVRRLTCRLLFSLFPSLSLSLFLSRSTHTLTHSRSQPTLHISVHGSPGRYTVYYSTIRGLKPSQHSYKNDIPLTCCIFTSFFFFWSLSLCTLSFADLFFVYLPSCHSKLICCFSSAQHNRRHCSFACKGQIIVTISAPKME